MKIDDEVKTEHGVGVIIHKDFPLTRAWRWVVKIKEPINERDIARQFCYHEKELVKIKN